MKNKRYLKKVFLWCGVLGMILIFFAGSVLFLYAQKQIVGENPIKGMNENFSHMPVTGKNYTLNYQQEQEYIKEEEQRESFIEQEIKILLYQIQGWRAEIMRMEIVRMGIVRMEMVSCPAEGKETVI